MKKVLFLFLFIIGLIVECNGNDGGVSDGILNKRKSKLSTIKKKLIKYIADKNGYNTEGWLDISKLSASDMRNIDLQIDNEKVICNRGNQLVSVTLLKEEFVMSVGAQGQFLLYLEYHNVDNGAKMLNPLPFVRENYVYKANGKNVAFPNGFKGYIVCLEKDKEAFLVPKFLKEIDFIEPEWEVRVNIQMLKNPLATFGRMYKIDILDNVSVLKNGDKSFFWPVPITSIIDIFELHLAIEDAEKGKYCRLSRLAATGRVILNCRKWRFTFAPLLSNIYAGFGWALLNGLIYATDIHKPSEVHYHIDTKYSNSKNDLVDARLNYTFPLPLDDSEDALAHDYKKEAKARSKKNYIVVNSIYIGLWLVANVIMQCISSGVIYKTMKRLHKKFQNASFAFPWKLSYIANNNMTQNMTNIKYEKLM